MIRSGCSGYICAWKLNEKLFALQIALKGACIKGIYYLMPLPVEAKIISFTPGLKTHGLLKFSVATKHQARLHPVNREDDAKTLKFIS